MRHQERILTSDNNIRNRIINIVNMSSDLCEFNEPTYIMSGATKITSGTTISSDSVHLIDTNDTFDLNFSFTGNTNSFDLTETAFKYNIYHYDSLTNVFNRQPIFSSGNIEWSSFSGTSTVSDSLLISDFIIDGEYIIKGSYEFSICTSFLSKLGVKNDTTLPLIGSKYDIYDANNDNYFILLNKASKPNFELTPTNTGAINSLRVETNTITENGQDTVEVLNTWSGSVLVSLNGLTLTESDENLNGDFRTVGKKIIFNSSLSIEDIVTIAYVTNGSSNGLLMESFIVKDPIVSGATDGEGENVYYFNTDTNKNEIYMLSEPLSFNDVIVTLNGVTLAKTMDYVQSTTNPKRLRVNGEILDGDVITITYNGFGTYVGNINVNSFDIFWGVDKIPLNNNGVFNTLVSSDISFSAGTIIYSATTSYVSNEGLYSTNINLTNYTGDTAFYKVVNQKKFTTVNGDVITTTTDSDVIPITLDL